MVAHSGILAWKSHGQRSLAGYSHPGVTNSQTRLSDSHTHTHTHIFIGRTDAEAEAPISDHLTQRTDWKRPQIWERLKAGGEGDNRGWDGWMASLTWWTWVWTRFRRWWRTEKPCMLQAMGSQRVECDWVTELNYNCKEADLELQSKFFTCVSKWKWQNRLQTVRYNFVCVCACANFSSYM